MKTSATILITASILISACGRSAPASLSVQVPQTEAIPPATAAATATTAADNLTQATAPAINEPAPNVAGTFVAPDAGVKVTSANTVVEPLKQSSDAQTITPSVPQTTTPSEPVAPASPGVAQTYVVQEGDTISVIANVKFGIKIADLLSVNDIGDRDEIKPGQTLKIPAN